jgi:hypothetical protein
MHSTRWRSILGAGLLALLGGGAQAMAGVHLWRVKELYSNGDGTIQFIELATCCGSTGENFTGGQVVSSNSHNFTIPGNVSGSTLNKHILLATSGFAALPGAPTPDHIIADSFFSTVGDTISFSVYDTLTFSAGQLPGNGADSLNKEPTSGMISTTRNSPTNFAGASGAVFTGSGPPGVPDGTGGTTPMTVSALSPDGSSLQVAYANGTCINAANHHILYGQKSNLPAAAGGAFSLLGSVCSIGASGPYAWAGTPQAADGSGLIWFVLVATNPSAEEGSWGKDQLGNERTGPGAGGASGTCSLVKDTANFCGHSGP